MATFEEREIVDYTMKKLEKVLGSENFMVKDLDKMHVKLEKQERRLKESLRKLKVWKIELGAWKGKTFLKKVVNLNQSKNIKYFLF